ncbi:SEC-C domain-containing protein [Candidatus Uhrbacteria bacterium]|nr:SEC-C domain-containing protein [Candidatus Uhrbacteria bacterium]
MLKFLLGDPNARVVRKLQPIVDRINALERAFEGLSADALQSKTVEFRKRLGSDEALDDLLPDAFAAVREAARRTLGQRHFDVQLIGGMVLHHGQIAEMRTGEGKTLTATTAVYLNALMGRGVHVVTVNDYLARRDCAWMGQIYHALGMSVACLNHETAYVYDAKHRSVEVSPPLTEGEREGVRGERPVPARASGEGEGQQRNADAERDATGAFKVAYDFLRPVSRKEAYLADITYGTNNEYGFDYLRDNMVPRLDAMVQRGHHYAIVDEVDSILIDEARTPLIISAPAEESTDQYRRFADLVRKLEAKKDYTIDEKLRAVSLTEEGITHVEQLLGMDNIYGQGTALVHQLEQALRASTLYQRDREYVVVPASGGSAVGGKDGEVIIVDEFTGRLMHGRRYSEGLHQAIEAKEGVAVQRESQTLATITFQNYFRLYKKLAGMTGTAATEAEEFAKIYGLEVVSIPTHKPMVRADAADRIYRTEEAKSLAVVAEVKERHERGQPVLLGTISIEKNEQLHLLFEREGVPHEMLNAKNHEREGEIIAQAGRRGAVTLATNMAGRGVDIILGGNPPNFSDAESVKKFGGLHVIGTERHESRRIDNQLRGRSGRQGDPGSSQFFVSLEDDLMRIFGGERLKGIMTRLGVPDDVPIENRLVSKQIESAQRKVEHHHFDTRKHLLDYDDVLNKHREVIYRKRREALESEDPAVVINEMVEREAERLVAAYTPGEHASAWDLEGFTRNVNAVIPLQGDFSPFFKGGARGGSQEEGKLSAAESRTTLIEHLVTAARSSIMSLRERIGSEEGFRTLSRAVVLRATDQLWIEHLDAIDHLRHGIGLRGYGQRDPLVEYKREAYRLFTELLALIQQDVVTALCHAVPTMEARSVFERRGIQLSGAQKEMKRGEPSINFSPSREEGEREGEGIRTVATPKRFADAEAVAQSSKPRDASGDKVGRNDPCPCGSGKKYKKCHGA